MIRKVIFYAAGEKVDILCAGLVIADILVKLERDYTFDEDLILVDKIVLASGGNALNTSLALSKIGVKTGVIGKVGCDFWGDFLMDVMKKHGCDARGVVRDPNVDTSLTVALVRRDGTRNFLHYRAASGSLTENDIDLDLVSEAKILHVAGGLLLPALDGKPLANILQKAQGRGVKTSLDIAWVHLVSGWRNCIHV